jgi:hypothetical protein
MVSKKKLTKIVYSLYENIELYFEPLEITYFRAYAKKLMQINKFLYIIHKLVGIVYEMATYEDTIFEKTCKLK